MAYLGKIESILFGSKRKLKKVESFDVKCGDITIKHVTSAKYLGQGWFDVHEDGEEGESFFPTVGHFDQLLVILIKVKCTVGHFLLSY